MDTRRVTQAVASATLLVALAATPAAHAQSSTQDSDYDDQMLCRFVITGNGGAWTTNADGTPHFATFWKDVDPADLANRTGIGGYYWATAYADEADGESRRTPRRQYWFYPWTVYEDDARADKGLGVVFVPKNLDSEGKVTKWVAEAAYTVGFVSYMEDWRCAERNGHPDGKLIDMTAMAADGCSWSRAHIQDSPHASPPGCE